METTQTFRLVYRTAWGTIARAAQVEAATLADAIRDGIAAARDHEAQVDVYDASDARVASRDVATARYLAR